MRWTKPFTFLKQDLLRKAEPLAAASQGAAHIEDLLVTFQVFTLQPRVGVKQLLEASTAEVEHL